MDGAVVTGANPSLDEFARLFEFLFGRVGILREELQVGGGPVALAQAVEELYMRTVYRAPDLEVNGREPDRPSFIEDCKDYYLEQAVRYVSSPTMDEAAAKAAMARLTELSDRVKRRLKFVFFELPSVRVQSAPHHTHNVQVSLSVTARVMHLVQPPRCPILFATDQFRAFVGRASGQK